VPSGPSQCASCGRQRRDGIVVRDDMTHPALAQAQQQLDD
jgi:hypothetical protein